MADGGVPRDGRMPSRWHRQDDRHGRPLSILDLRVGSKVYPDMTSGEGLRVMTVGADGDGVRAVGRLRTHHSASTTARSRTRGFAGSVES